MCKVYLFSLIQKMGGKAPFVRPPSLPPYKFEQGEKANIKYRVLVARPV